MTQKQTKRSDKKILKCLILVSTGYAIVMMLHWPVGFTLFTQLSNLYVAGVVLAQILFPEHPGLLAWKFTATVSITVTFLVFLVAISWLQPGGMLAAYAQDHCASLCLHLITPLLTIADFLIYDAPRRQWSLRNVWHSLLPPSLYYVFVLTLGLTGFDWWGMSGPYAFLNFAAPAGWFGFQPESAGAQTFGIGVFYVLVVMVGLFFAMGYLFLQLAQRRNRVEGTV